MFIIFTIAHARTRSTICEIALSLSLSLSLYSLCVSLVSLCVSACVCDGVCVSYGDSMILAECIFSQSAPGEVPRAYFRMQGTCVHHVSGHVQTCSDMSNMSRHDTHHLQAACIFSLA